MISSASSGTTFQRRNESYAPVFLSTATRTSISSEYFFFVAEASAISSAPKTMSRGTFFSLASTSTSMISSRFPPAMVAAGLFASTLFAAAFVATIASQFRNQPRPLDIVERQRDCLSVQLHVHLSRLRASQDADKLAPAGSVRRAHPDLGLLAGETREIARLAQRPAEPRGSPPQPLESHAFHRQHAGELPAHRGAIVHGNAARLVDEHTQHPTAVRRLHVDQLISHAAHCRLNLRFRACHSLPGSSKKKCAHSHPRPSATKAFEV